jgi:tetratricopeptide (TPR) repeat protein
MNKLILIIVFFICSFVQGQTFETYLSEAKTALTSGMYRKAYDSSTKAIELNGSSSEVRWIRIKASLTANAPKERLETAITDLNYLSQSGEQTSIVYKTLGTAESELASFIYRFNRTVSGYEKESVLHYENAKKAFIKASELSPELVADLKYKINDTDTKIKEIQNNKS